MVHAASSAGPRPTHLGGTADPCIWALARVHYDARKSPRKLNQQQRIGGQHVWGKTLEPDATCRPISTTGCGLQQRGRNLLQMLPVQAQCTASHLLAC